MITASRFDADENDIAQGLSQCLTRDGQGSGMTGPLSITLVSGTRPLTIKGSGGTSLTIDKTASGNAANILGMTAGVLRWVMVLGTNTAESGGNAGSDFVLTRYSDAGAAIDNPLTINRASGLISAGQISISGVLTAGAQISLNGTVAAGTRVLQSYTSGSLRWQMMLGDTGAESGANAGSNFQFNAFSDSGGALGNVFNVIRSTRTVTFGVAIVNGPSDRSMKENIAPLEGSLDKVRALQGVSFNMIGDEDKRRQIGLVAQDVAPVVPEVIQEFRSGDDEPKLALDYPKLTALLIEAVKEQQARIEALEKRLT